MQFYRKELIIDILESLVSSFVVLIVIYLFLAFPEVVSGASMEPEFENSDRILVERISKRFGTYERGDVVVFHPPGEDNIDYIKRIIGVPGDVVKIEDCGVYVTRDGERFFLDEPYLGADSCTEGMVYFPEGRATRLNEGEFFVLGDNRGNSADSRVLGPIDDSRIVGKVVFRFWPINKITFF